eukprot:TRINITY_DN80701_c0_g1_i1.p1 TRINITY_DN80701_c0_g1~~TRINITY_DN80701_c0_g1_i1.p1  ORF type:complete len:763 (+),score=159.71 TRINITY_DN80701_c0_g1_i1:98-2386(+)
MAQILVVQQCRPPAFHGPGLPVAAWPVAGMAAAPCSFYAPPVASMPCPLQVDVFNGAERTPPGTPRLLRSTTPVMQRQPLGVKSPRAAACHRPLVQGEVTSIGARQFLVGTALGQGAYGRVFAGKLVSASGTTGVVEDVAIKELKCGKGPGILSDASVQRAHFEISVLQRLAPDTDSEGSSSCESVEARVPRILEQQFWSLGPEVPGALLCRIAMTRCPGQPLIDWLDARLQRGDVGGSSPSSSEERAAAYCASFCKAAHVARTMLVQLAPIFERLNGMAYHRDVNARNILVHCPPAADGEDEDAATGGAAPAECSRLLFSVVDFGSSVDAAGWHGGGDGSWQQENPTGDARYWCAATWQRFIGGSTSLDAVAVRQYAQRVDMYALAVCALEVLGTLHTEFPLSDSAFSSLPRSSVFEAKLARCVQRLQIFWEAYWATAVGAFDRLAEYSTLACSGDMALAYTSFQEITMLKIPERMRHRLQDLKNALTAAAQLCRLRPSRAGLGGSGYEARVGSTLEVLADMLHEGGALQWMDLKAKMGAPGPGPSVQRSKSVPPLADARRQRGAETCGSATPRYMMMSREAPPAVQWQAGFAPDAAAVAGGRRPPAAEPASWMVSLSDVRASEVLPLPFAVSAVPPRPLPPHLQLASPQGLPFAGHERQQHFPPPRPAGPSPPPVQVEDCPEDLRAADAATCHRAISFGASSSQERLGRIEAEINSLKQFYTTVSFDRERAPPCPTWSAAGYSQQSASQVVPRVGFSRPL